MILFEFEPSPGFDFLNSFAEQINEPVQSDKLLIPQSLGEGAIRRLDLSPEFKLIVHRYRLNEDFKLVRRSSKEPHDLVSIIFHSNEDAACLSTDEKRLHLSKNTEYAIQIASTDLESEIRFPAGADINFVVLGVRLPVLQQLLNISNPNNVVQTIFNGGQGFLFYERMNPELQKTLKQITETVEDDLLRSLFYRIKTQELLYQLFAQLMKRDSYRHATVHKDDIDKLMLIRTTIVADLSIPPRLQELSKMSGLGETKMKDLFKQVFGESIYNYYQKARMDEAAFLLRNASLSVSEVGYNMGFVNLSHFSRVFEKHYGEKPKKYSSGR